MDGKETAEEEKFRDFYGYSETILTSPSLRGLALFRGRNAGVLMRDEIRRDRLVHLMVGRALESEYASRHNVSAAAPEQRRALPCGRGALRPRAGARDARSAPARGSR